MTVTGSDFIALQVRDTERAAAFYERQLGLACAPSSRPGVVVFATRPVAFAVREPLPGVDLDAVERPGLGVALWLHADDSQRLHDALAADGVTIIRPPSRSPFGLAFRVLDPDGLRGHRPRRALTPGAARAPRNLPGPRRSIEDAGHADRPPARCSERASGRVAARRCPARARDRTASQYCAVSDGVTMSNKHSMSQGRKTVADRIEADGLPEGVHAHDPGTATVADRIEADKLPEGVHAHDPGTATVADRIEADGLKKR